MARPCDFCGGASCGSTFCTAGREVDATPFMVAESAERVRAHEADLRARHARAERLTAAVAGWRAVKAEHRAAALAAISKEAGIAAAFPNLCGLVAHALDRAVELLGAAGADETGTGTETHTEETGR